MVYYHPEDKHEILSLKKVLASVLSVRVVVSIHEVSTTFFEMSFACVFAAEKKETFCR